MLEELKINYQGEEKWDFWLYVLLFVLLNPVTKWGQSDLVLLLATVLLGGYLFIIRKDKPDMIVVWVIVYWIVVNFASFSFLKEPGYNFKISTFGGSVLKLGIGYGIMKLAGIRFIPWFYKITYFHALISIPFFVMQLVDPSIFKALPFNAVISYRELEGHWNGIIFNYSTWHPFQNSGFAGESGTFGYYIGLAMICNLILYRGKYNKHFIILLLIGLTTVSTNFVLTIGLFGMFFLSFAPWSTKLILGTFCVVVMIFAFQLPFMGEKIDTYVEETVEMTNIKVVKSTRVNRLATLTNHIKDVIHYPFGYGINQAQRTKNIYGWIIDGTNGISRIAVYFGVFGLLYFIYINFKLMRILTDDHPGAVLLLGIILMYIGANPTERDWFAMTLFWLYYLIDKSTVQNMLNRWERSKL